MNNATKWLAAPLLFALAVSLLGLAALAQGRGRGHDRGFNDHDRAEVHAWMDKHHDHPPVGFRDRDRLPPEMESGLRVGVVLGPAYRRRFHPVPHDLLIELAPPPPRYRYVVLGDHICLVDGGYHLVDVIHLELNF